MTDTPDAAEREALAKIINAFVQCDDEDAVPTLTSMYRVADEILAAGFRRAPEPAREAKIEDVARVVRESVSKVDHRFPDRWVRIATAIMDGLRNLDAQPAPQQGGEDDYTKMPPALTPEGRVWSGRFYSRFIAMGHDNNTAVVNANHAADVVLYHLATPAPAAPVEVTDRVALDVWCRLKALGVHRSGVGVPIDEVRAALAAALAAAGKAT